MIVLGPDRATVEVLVFREGLLSAVGHDLVLRVTAFELAIDPAAPSVVARLDPASLRVASAVRDGRPLPGALRPRDVAEIEDAIASAVLRVRRFPELRFESTAVAPREGGWEVRGALALAGVTRPLTVPVRRAGERVLAAARLHQPDFGIAPYRAMLGALRVKPDVEVRLSAPAEGL